MRIISIKKPVAFGTKTFLNHHKSIPVSNNQQNYCISHRNSARGINIYLEFFTTYLNTFTSFRTRKTKMGVFVVVLLFQLNKMASMKSRSQYSIKTKIKSHLSSSKTFVFSFSVEFLHDNFKLGILINN